MVSTQNKQMAQFFASMTERMSRTDLDLATIRDVYETLHWVMSALLECRARLNQVVTDRKHEFSRLLFRLI